MKLQPFMVRLGDNEKAFIKRCALVNEISEAEVIRVALRYYCEENGIEIIKKRHREYESTLAHSKSKSGADDFQ